MHTLRHSRIVAVVAIFALFSTVALGGGVLHSALAAAQTISMHDDSCDHDRGDERTGQLLCHLVCAGTAVISERPPDSPAPAPQEYFGSFDIAVAGLAAPPDPHPPRNDI